MAIRALGPGASREPDLLTRSDLEIPTRQPLRAWYEAAAAARTRRVNVLTIGDSITEGTTLENQVYEAWPTLLGEAMSRATGGQRGATGYVSAAYGNNTSAWTLSGSPVIRISSSDYRGLGRRSLEITSTSSATYSFYGTNCALYYTRTAGSGVMGISVDGGGVTSVSTINAGGEINSARYVPAALSRGWHTITISRVSGGSVYLEGAAFWDADFAAGIALWDGSHSGINSAFLVGSSDKERWAAMLNSIDPDLVIIALGTNDSSAAEVPGVYTPEIYGERIRSIINLIRANAVLRNPSFILLQQPQPPAIDATYWKRHMDALQAVADSEPGVMTMDLRPVIPSGPASGSTNLYNDSLHPSAQGARLYALEIARQLQILGSEPTPGPRILTGQDVVAWATTKIASDATIIKFPPGFFSTAPTVLVGRGANANAVPTANFYLGSTSTTQTAVVATSGASTAAGTTIPINWIAIGQ